MYKAFKYLTYNKLITFLETFFLFNGEGSCGHCCERAISVVVLSMYSNYLSLFSTVSPVLYHYPSVIVLYSVHSVASSSSACNGTETETVCGRRIAAAGTDSNTKRTNCEVSAGEIKWKNTQGN